MERKTGKELIDDFFREIEQRQDLDKDVVKILVNLFKSNKLTENNIYNELEKIIKNEKI